MEFKINERAEEYLSDTGAVAFIPDIILANRKKDFDCMDYQSWKFIRRGVGNWRLICKNEMGKEVFRKTVQTFSPMQDNILKYEFLILKGELQHITSPKKQFYLDEHTGKTCWIIK